MCEECAQLRTSLKAAEERAARLQAEARVCFDAGVTFGFAGGFVHAQGKPVEDISAEDVRVPNAVLCDVYWKHWADKLSSAPGVAKWSERLAAAEAQRDRLTAALRKVEWSGWDWRFKKWFCLECGGHPDVGHDAGCVVGAALAVTPLERDATTTPGEPE